MSNSNINISGTQGDVIGVGVSGSSHVVGKDVSFSGGIHLGSENLSHLPKELAESLRVFTVTATKEIQKQKISPEQIEPIQKEVTDLAKEVEHLPDPENVSFSKKATITAKLARVVKGLLKVLPSTAETITSFTPLAPFGNIIGQSIEEVVKAVRKEV